MKIKKIYQGELPENKILNTQSTSQTDTYSCEYINNLDTGGGESYTLPVASTDTLGGIKVGNNLSIAEDGTLSAEVNEGITEIPIASPTTLGGIKVGANLYIEEDGTLNATGGSGGASGTSELNFIHIMLSQQQTLNVYGNQPITTDYELRKYGFRLSHVDNKIVVGAGVNHVRMSGYVDVTFKNNRSGSSTLNGGVTVDLNTSDTGYIMKNIKDSTTQTIEFCLPSTIIEVKEGDTICLATYTSSQNMSRTINSAHLTVEVVD